MNKIFSTFSGVYLIFMGCLFGVSFIAQMMSLCLSCGDDVPYQTLLVLILFFIWAMATGIGIFFKKDWAYLSRFVLSMFFCFIGIVSLVSLTMADPADIPSKSLARIFLSIFMILIPASFLFFLRYTFVKKEPAFKCWPNFLAKKPWGVLLVALFWLLSGISTLLFLIKPTSTGMVFLGGVIISGKWLTICLLLYMVAAFYNAIGILMMWRAAWWTGMVTGAMIVILGVVNFFLIPMPVIPYKIASILGLILPSTVIIYLVRRKDLFIS